VTQRVIVTAAARGIGRSIAAAFLTAGARVHICDVDGVAIRSFEDGFPDARAALVDLADPVSVDAWLGDAIADLGGVDVLVNNAGTKGPTAFVEDVTLDEWRSCLAVTLDSHFQCARRVAPLMKAQGSGSIINLSSMAGLVGYGMRSPYAAAKWAVVGLTKSLAIELGPHNVRCNCICPGSVSGDRMDRVATAEAELRRMPVDVVTAEYVAGQSIKRFVEPDEIAQLCLFLASSAASMITGQAIAIDGHSETYRL
jgi:NAD(P)-dependent dehydrogenase (short-subunit alcohol dehydrogenase family)